MTLVATLARQHVTPIVTPGFMDDPVTHRVEAGIKRGIQDSNAGRVRPWAEVKEELGIR